MLLVAAGPSTRQLSGLGVVENATSAGIPWASDQQLQWFVESEDAHKSSNHRTLATCRILNGSIAIAD